MPPRKPKPAPVTVSKLHPALKKYLRNAERVQIIDARTIIVWNSTEQKRRLQRKVRRA